MTLKTTNLTFCHYIAVDETVRYTPHPSDSSKTLLTQEAVVTVQVSASFIYLYDVIVIYPNNWQTKLEVAHPGPFILVSLQILRSSLN